MSNKGVFVESIELELDEVSKIKLDGYDEHYGYAVEVYAHIGKPKGSQPKKIATDILKLSLLDVEHKVFIAHKSVITWLKGESWIALAASKNNIELFEGYFTKRMITLITKTQKDQDISR